MYAGFGAIVFTQRAVFFAPIGEEKLLKIKQARRWRWVALLVTPGDVLLQSVWLHSGFKSGDYGYKIVFGIMACFAFCGAVVS